MVTRLFIVDETLAGQTKRRRVCGSMKPLVLLPLL